MKAVMIIFNQAHTEKVEYMLDYLDIRGFTMWEEITGRGSKDGEPHMGTHTWPEKNSTILTIVDDDKVNVLLNKVKQIDEINTEVGIRAFVWQIDGGY